MKPDIKMIGLDLDGTTLNSNGEVTPAVKEAVQKALNAGIIVLPATGRQLTGIPQQIMGLPGLRYAVTANGASVVDLETRQVIYSDCFPTPQALEILQLLQSHEGLAGLYIDGTGYAQTDHLEQYIGSLSPGLAEYFRTSRVAVDDLREFLLAKQRPVEKLTILFKEAAERQRALTALEQRGDCCVTSSLEMNLEINTFTANKGAGLLALAKHLGISRAQVMAIGDSSNDYAMLQAVGYAVAMGNAPPNIKAVANSATASNDEDGVAKAIAAILP